VDFTEFEPSVHGEENAQGLDFILDIPLEITVELGRTKIQVGDLLKLGQGSVVELEKLTNEPVDVFINQKLMAHGEVVVVNDKFGVRLTNIITPNERVKKLV
jgi:flagellar motor switch protein FliN/FliY